MTLEKLPSSGKRCLITGHTPLGEGQPPSNNREMQETPAPSLEFKISLKGHPASNHPVRLAEGLKTVCSPASPSPFPPEPPPQYESQKHSLLYVPHAQLRLRICFSKNPTHNNPVVRIKSRVHRKSFAQDLTDSKYSKDGIVIVICLKRSVLLLSPFYR